MTVSVFIRHKVDDFATWKELYNEGAQMRKDHNVLADNVYRDPDDPNMAMVHLQFADVSAAKAQVARLDSDEFRSMAKTIGLHLDMREVWIGENV
jgi:hypothetical protein